MTAAPRFVGRGLQLILLTIAAAAGAYARTLVSPLQEAMRVALSMSDNEIALLQGPALGLPLLIAAIPLGIMIDRYSRVRLILIFSVCDLCGTVLTAVADSFSILFVARSVVGLSAVGTGIVALSLLPDLYEPAQRGRASMFVVIGQYGGMASSFVLGGEVIAMGSAGANDWRSTMLLLSVALVPVIFLILAMREPARTGVSSRGVPGGSSSSRLRRNHATVAALSVGLAMAEIAIGAVLVWAAPTLSREFSLPPERVGVIMSVVVLFGGILGSTVGGLLADVCQRIWGGRGTLYALSGVAFVSALGALFPMMPGQRSASCLLFFYMTLIGASIVIATTLFTIIIPGESRGRYLAAMTAANALFASAIGPMVVSLLSASSGGVTMIGRTLTLICVSTCVFGGASYALGGKIFPRDIAL